MLRGAFKTTLIFGAILFASDFAGGRTVSELLDFPPAFHALFGDPEIVQKPPRAGSPNVRLSGVGEYRPFFGVQRNSAQPKAIVRGIESETELRKILADAYSLRFYREVIDPKNLSRYERRLEMGELINLSEEEFVSLSNHFLTGADAGSTHLDAWWTVRMGLPQTPDPSHNLLVTVIHSDRGIEPRKESMGHLSLGLRHRNGRADSDFIVDFRAPWNLDRPPKPLEGFNFGNALKLAGFTENLYDWLHTQTAYRGCYVKVWFLPISREQTVLLRHFDEKIEVHKAGNFRALRKNCTSLAVLFYDRLQPIHEPIYASLAIADLPLPTALKIVSDYGDVPFARVENITDDLGREPTARSEIHRAVPTRATSRAFRALKDR